MGEMSYPSSADWKHRNASWQCQVLEVYKFFLSEDGALAEVDVC